MSRSAEGALEPHPCHTTERERGGIELKKAEELLQIPPQTELVEMLGAENRGSEDVVSR